MSIEPPFDSRRECCPTDKPHWGGGPMADEPLFATPRVQARLRGEPHRHHSDCIHNLPPDEQIKLRGRTRDWWERMGLPEPVQITPDDWASDGE